MVLIPQFLVMASAMAVVHTISGRPALTRFEDFLTHGDDAQIIETY